MGLSLSAAHDGRVTARRHRGGRHVLDGLRLCEPDPVRRHVWGAHLPGLGRRRDGLLWRLPDTAGTHMHPYGGCGVPVLLASWLRRRTALDLLWHLRLPHRRLARRRLRGTPAAAGQALAGWCVTGVALRSCDHHLLCRTARHQVRLVCLYRHGYRGNTFTRALHDPAHLLRDGTLTWLGAARDQGDLRRVLPDLPGDFSLLPHRDGSQVRHGGDAALRLPTLLQHDLLLGTGHHDGGRACLQTTACETCEHLVKS